MLENLNLLFNKTYYTNYTKIGHEKDFEGDIKNNNKQLFETKFCREDYTPSPMSGEDGYTSFCMVTSYPGLLVGTGYAHAVGRNDKEIKLGFSFDYVTGQPYIPGSSIKGVLRSCFDHPEVIEDLLPDCKGEVQALEKDVFEEDGDIFFDAVIRKGNKTGLILGSDYITPHESLISNPTPIHMVKILPDVVLEFRFILKDSTIGGVTSEKKKKLFSALLAIQGVGAKTNVGYGALEPIFKGTVTGITKYGVFVRLDGKEETGLVHNSEIPNKHVLSVGGTVYVKVLEIKPDGKIRLSMKGVPQGGA